MTVSNGSEINYSRIDEIINGFDAKKSNLIAILQKVQSELNYLPEDVLAYIGTKIKGLSPATVYGVATFYAQFSLDPKGKHIIRMCDGTACHVRGSMPVLRAVKAKLGLAEGEKTTKDGMFSIEIVSCLGACGLAPVVVIDEKVYPQMTADAVKIIIDEIIKKENEG